jgi:glutamate synthase (ferredoxin)
MTGGTAVILGEVGRNFGAGMSGGIAYVLDLHKNFDKRCNKEALNLLKVEEDQDIQHLKGLIENHYNATLSPLAQRILENWGHYLPRFIKIFPEEYKQALLRLEQEKLQTI